MTDTKRELLVRAASSDNDLEIQQIISLLSDNYGGGFPIRRAYEPQFWRSLLGSRLVSLVGIQQGRIVAHLAYSPDRDNHANVQILFPLCAPGPDSHCLQEEFGRRAVEIILRQSERQHWSLLYFFAFSTSPELQNFSSSVLDATAMALCPGYLPPKSDKPSKGRTKHSASSEFNPQRAHVIVSQRLCSPASYLPLTLHLPRAHHAVCRYLYEPLGIEIQLLDSPATAAAARARSGAAAGDPGYERRFHASTSACHVFIQPDYLSDTRKTLLEISGDQAQVLYVFVNLTQSGAASFCSALEEQGFRFSGVLPFLKNRHSAVYYRYRPAGLSVQLSPSPEAFLSERARTLAYYIRHYELPDEAGSANHGEAVYATGT